MAIELATAYVSLVASAKGIKASIDKELSPLEQSAKEVGDKAGKSFESSFSKQANLTDFSKKGLAATAVLSAGLFKAADAAGGLEAAMAANVQILGDASNEVQDWAKTSVDSVGLSERAALDAATSFGQLAKIAGEMISFAAVEALASELWPDALSAVASVPDARKGERLIMVTQKKDPSRSEFQAFARSHGATELMVPAEIVYVEKLPLLGTGKIDNVSVTKLIKERFAAAPAPQAAVVA